MSLNQKKTRGPTRNIALLALRPGERVKVAFNEYNQLVRQKKGKRLQSYIGTLVRNQHNIPLQVSDWNHVPNDAKEKIWALVLEKFEVDEERKDYILGIASNKYRSYKNRMKAKYYNPWPTDEQRLMHKPPFVCNADWRWLVQYWSSEEAQIISKRNKENRAKQKINHTSGSKSFAQFRYEQGQLREDGLQPNRIEMFKLTHTRKNGIPVDEASREIMAKFEELMAIETQSQIGESSSSTTSTLFSSTSLSVDDVYKQVMGPERHGRVRGLGFGPTPSSVFGATSRKQANVALESKLKDTQEELLHFKQMHKEHEEKMQKQIEQQQKQMELMQNHMQQMQQMMQQMLQFQQRELGQQGCSHS